jgi:hypothetical protein
LPGRPLEPARKGMTAVHGACIGVIERPFCGVETD